MLIWFPGKKVIPGNKPAEELAKASVTATGTPSRPISLATAEGLTDPLSNRPQTVIVCDIFS